ncbi:MULTISPECIES: SDR family oxidoreductase [Pseudomonas]|uniref:UDP-glucose 4-epimerase family protein n=1 Tax=Pseudomonas TaxID=286 RepID=UPI0030033E20
MKQSKKILVTGASGLVGRAFVERLLKDGDYEPVIAARGATGFESSCVILPFDLARQTNISISDDIEVVVHAAARVHVMEEPAAEALSEYRKINVEATERLARQAVSAGVKRFIFISTIKVNGEETILDQPFTADDKPAPSDPYAVSKYEAELALKEIAATTSLEVVIIRPALVYGPGVKANFHRLMKWLGSGLPLPLGAIKNKRSLLFVDNLVDLIITCVVHPAAGNQIFLACDGYDLSTTELLQHLSRALSKNNIIIPVSEKLLLKIASLIGKRSVARRLLGSLQIDISKNHEVLDWYPPISVKLGIKNTVDYYLRSRH